MFKRPSIFFFAALFCFSFGAGLLVKRWKITHPIVPVVQEGYYQSAQEPKTFPASKLLWITTDSPHFSRTYLYGEIDSNKVTRFTALYWTSKKGAQYRIDLTGEAPVIFPNE